MRTLLVSVALLCVAVLPAAETVIVHAGNATAQLDEGKMKDLFLGKSTSWEAGGSVKIAIAKEGAATEALMGKLGKNVSQFTTGWKKLVFTGKGSMPETVDNDEAVVAFVAANPGAIGFVDDSKVKDGVKAIALK